MKIAFTGSHSTGKTTLLSQILETYPKRKIQYVHEIAREVIHKGFPLGKNANIHSYIMLLNEYYKKILSLDNNADTITIYDRTLLDIVAYLKINEQLPRPYIPTYFIDLVKSLWLLEKDLFDVYFFFPIEFEMEKDPNIRDEDEKYRQGISTEIKNTLDQHETHYIIVKGNPNDRMNIFDNIINSLSI